jgi:hypothetical protein
LAQSAGASNAATILQNFPKNPGLTGCRRAKGIVK